MILIHNRNAPKYCNIDKKPKKFPTNALKIIKNGGLI